MISLRFSRAEYELVSKRLRFDDFLTVVEHPTFVKCDITEDHADNLHDQLIHLFDSAGFGADWEPNSLGYKLEKLIDLVHDTLEEE